jgi:hypothetical protein
MPAANTNKIATMITNCLTVRLKTRNENSVPSGAIRGSLYLFQIVKQFQVRQCCRVIVLREAKKCHITDHFEHIYRKVKSMEDGKESPHRTGHGWPMGAPLGNGMW